MVNEMTVFVVHQARPPRNAPSYDLTPALAFGTIESIFPHNIHPSLETERAAHLLDEWEFDEEQDFLLWAGGDVVAMALVTAELRRRNIPYFRFLRWERDRDSRMEAGPTKGYYEPRTIDIN